MTDVPTATIGGQDAIKQAVLLKMSIKYIFIWKV